MMSHIASIYVLIIVTCDVKLWRKSSKSLHYITNHHFFWTSFSAKSIDARELFNFFQWKYSLFWYNCYMLKTAQRNNLILSTSLPMILDGPMSTGTIKQSTQRHSLNRFYQMVIQHCTQEVTQPIDVLQLELPFWAVFIHLDME